MQGQSNGRHAVKNLNPIFWLIAVAVVGLGIAGYSFCRFATDIMANSEDKTRSLVAGITCLVLATGLLVLGAFMFRKHD